MDLYPDNKFEPNEQLSRAGYAVICQRLIKIVTHDDSLDTKYIGEKSHIADLRSDHFAYNSIMVCIERGIMSLELDGSFGIKRPVSGADALLVIRKLKNAL